MNTGVGNKRGDFQRYLLPANENTEPHSPSIAAATTGTSACLAINSNPRWIAINWPVREMWPSGHTQTTSPAFKAAIAAFIPGRGASEEIAIDPLISKTQLKKPFRLSPW